MLEGSFMKITEKRLKEIIKEEIQKINELEQQMEPDDLELEVGKIMSTLESPQQAILKQYIDLIKGDK